MRAARYLSSSLVTLCWLALNAPLAEAQTCWAYVDATPATPGISCVQRTDITIPCSWNNGAGDCTTVPSSSSQTMLQMHTAWHDCFGNTGTSTPPAGRGQRWYAFHRQFEFDFNMWREGINLFKIEQQDWCPQMNLVWGHNGAGLASGTHVANCGEGTGRPANNECRDCTAMPQCLFHSGAGPIACANAPSTTCSAPGSTVTLSHTALDQFPDVDEISLILDAFFHADMHSAVSTGDGLAWDGGGSVLDNNDDCTNPNCSPRDPMFWRLHKALDDVVRAWQDSKAVDVMMVVDRSGSMSGSDASGKTKLEAALDAVDYYGDLLEDGRTDGQTNRIGIVTYSSTASLALPLTNADANLRSSGSAFNTALSATRTAGPGGCTAIGAGIQRAIDELCQNGDCRQNPSPAPAGTNARKAILLLTDGLENEPPCLSPAGPSGFSCTSVCFGPQFAYENLEFTQLVGVGFGQSSSLNGDLLTLLTERQGGIYVQNPNGPTDDLKYFYAMAFGQLTDEFLLVDPRGRLEAEDPATPPVHYGSCEDDKKLTFTGGWQHETGPQELRLLVNAPSGDLVRGGGAGVELSSDSLWATSRVRLPHNGEAVGTWRAQLVRPHRQYANAFATDAFARPSDGITIVRREIQRLCPEGCKRTLYFEQGRIEPTSVYEAALRMETAAGLLASVDRIDRPDEFARALNDRRWDLLVYARMGDDQAEPYDATLSRLLCRGQRAIVTDTRRRAAREIHRCLGVALTEPYNYAVMEDAAGLLDSPVKMHNPGHQIATHAFETVRVTQARELRSQRPVVAAQADSGQAHQWFLDILGAGLGKLSPVRSSLTWNTGSELIASARILPSFHRAGGWDHVDARVEVEYPTIGLGTLVARDGRRDSVFVNGELLSPRAASLANLVVPTSTAAFPLYDDGTHGDLNPSNGHWTARLPGVGATDGTYRFRFIFDLTADGCMTTRETNQSMFVDVGVDPRSSGVRVVPADADVTGRTSFDVVLRPADQYGNLLGPGRAEGLTCAPGRACSIRQVTDNGDGSYTVRVLVAPGLPGVRLGGFNANFDIRLPCEDCVRLGDIRLDARTITEHQSTVGVVTLRGIAPKLAESEGVVVHLSSSTRVASVPDSVIVPVGETSVRFPITTQHVEGDPVQVTVTATYGGEVRSQPLIVRPRPAVRPADNGQQEQAPPRQGGPDAGLRLEGAQSSAGTATQGTQALAGVSSASLIANSLVSGPSFGSSNARVTVVEFSDYQCPYCRSFQENTFPQLRDRYVRSGRVRWVVRDFPIAAIHPYAFKAAEAAACAEDQGQFEEMRRVLYTLQANLSEGNILANAQGLTFDQQQFKACFLGGEHAQTVVQSATAASTAGVSGTPTFLILGPSEKGGGMEVLQTVQGAVPFEEFSQTLDTVLAKYERVGEE